MTSFVDSRTQRAESQRLTVTSTSRPITVSRILSWAAVGPSEAQQELGSLGLSFCPGKTVKSKNSPCWQRDLSLDLSVLRTVHKIQTIVCLLSDAELRSLHLRDYGSCVQAAGMAFVQHAIIDMSPPPDDAACHALVMEIAGMVQDGQAVLVHCRGGIGRAGMIAACVLLALDLASDADQAITQVRARRDPDAVQTSRQREYVSRFYKHLHSNE